MQAGQGDALDGGGVLLRGAAVELGDELGQPGLRDGWLEVVGQRWRGP